MGQDFQVRWSKFVEIPKTSSLVGYNRLLSNWHRTRARLDQDSQSTNLHRISAKRVIIEIFEPQKVKRRRSLPMFSVAFIGGVAALCLVVSITTFESNVVKGQAEKYASSTPTVSSSADSNCQDLRKFKGFEIADLTTFEFGGWRIESYSTARSLGSVWFVSFEAKCADQIVEGVLTTQEINGGYRILRMTPT